ncbi:hypothetical protein SAY87_027489 [Trapa incisa]|uniref:Exostosin GT47 domain-containing protein n=1 Tax=Trapa incisa TaxID=236973 RepID=A0AAN7JMC2_9MYRT|nr:hypothetical protein SAY87_027489 [Trapa incisa]
MLFGQYITHCLEMSAEKGVRLLSPSAKLLVFAVPLALVSFVVLVAGPGSSGGLLLSDYSLMRWNFGFYKKHHLHSRSDQAAGGAVARLAAAGPRMAVLEGHNKQIEEEPSAHTVVPKMMEVTATEPAASAPASLEVSHGHELNNFTVKDGVDDPPTASKTVILPEKALPRREYTKLDRLEASLKGARSTIREAMDNGSTGDPDYIPVGPMYRNANAFHRSYLEMEKQFKVFVYEEGEPPVFHNGPCKSIYSMEGNFIHMMETNARFRTRDPERAHAFFLPFSVVMMVQFVYVRDSHDFGPIKQTVIDYLNVVSTKYPFWNRSLGSDHFMLACHDWVIKADPLV